MYLIIEMSEKTITYQNLCIKTYSVKTVEKHHLSNLKDQFPSSETNKNVHQLIIQFYVLVVKILIYRD